MVIETEGLRKVYGQKVAVADLSLQVPRGEVFGFLGPNGAGKSTSVKMLLGLVAPVGGKAQVLGHPPGDTPTMARIGFLPEHFRFQEWLQAYELLDMYGRLYGMPKATRQERIPEMLELVGLQDHARRPIAGFSKGMLQRIGLAQALLNKPELVFLDEPTSALDPFGRMLVRKIIHTLKEQGTTVFLNSHLLGEVEATCDRVTFIKEGRVIQTVVLDDFRQSQFVVELRVDAITPALLDALAQVLGERPTPPSPTTSDHAHAPTPDHDHTPDHAPVVSLELTVPTETLLPSLAEQVIASGAKLYALIPHHISLEQLFLSIVGEKDSGQ
jgi:ABC-2 type transport system ATP-binding protein